MHAFNVKYLVVDATFNLYGYCLYMVRMKCLMLPDNALYRCKYFVVIDFCFSKVTPMGVRLLDGSKYQFQIG